MISRKIYDISQISTLEYALTLASWHVYIDPQFQCKATEELYKKRKDADTVIDYERNRKGCGVITDSPKVEIDGISFHSCLCHDDFIDITLHDSLFLYKQFENGTLAYNGGLLDQPSKYIELMRLMNRLRTEYDIEMQKKQDK